MGQRSTHITGRLEEPAAIYSTNSTSAFHTVSQVPDCRQRKRWAAETAVPEAASQMDGSRRMSLLCSITMPAILNQNQIKALRNGLEQYFIVLLCRYWVLQTVFRTRQRRCVSSVILQQFRAMLIQRREPASSSHSSSHIGRPACGQGLKLLL